MEAKGYEIDGTWHTLKEWAVLYGLTMGALYKRLQRGMSLVDALKRTARSHHTPPTTHTLHGRTQTVVAWAAEYGIPVDRLYKRLSRGVSLDVALNYVAPPRMRDM